MGAALPSPGLAPRGALAALALLALLSGAGADEAAVVCAGTACYTAHLGRVDADEAQRRCSHNGGNLASVRSRDEQLRLQAALTRLLGAGTPQPGRTKFWIGLRRAKGSCGATDGPLRGFSWVGGPEGGGPDFADWYKEPKSSCVAQRCVALLLEPGRDGPSQWADVPCGSAAKPGSRLEGYLCRFSFQGMCPPLALAGPGLVVYTTPFGPGGSALDAVPFGSEARVQCGEEPAGPPSYAVCQARGAGVFGWHRAGPLCASARLGCSYNRGGCEQECLEGGDGSFRCGCRPGYRLQDDLVSCAPRDPCGGQCPGRARCVPGPRGHECRCPAGLEPGPDGRGCVDVDECARGPGAAPCTQLCANTDGSFACSCRPGFAPAGQSGADCVDLDECRLGRPCPQLCFNLPGSYRCGCRPGWHLGPDGAACLADGTDRGHEGRPGEEEEEVEEEEEEEEDKEELVVLEEKGVTKGSIGKAPYLSPSASPSPFLSPFPSFAPSPPSSGVGRAPHVPPTWGRPPHQPHPPISRAPGPRTTTSRRGVSGAPGTPASPSPYHPAGNTPLGTADSGAGTDALGEQGDSSRLLLFCILGVVAVILLLLAIALGVLFSRRRKAKRAEVKTPPSTTDNYSWVPERAEGRAVENEYR
ncbi:complement component C1q receptor [Tachyglossus aculeatus]|uniref:complement component C1q receptor n=1 Tax=Tachyglossus aculeatus TaxID=9261 RepID=UPI0018F2E53C|nr:complement component C1q receptor [Tachyglossus aculeatus]